MKDQTVIIISIVVIVLALAVFFYFKKSGTATTSTTTTADPVKETKTIDTSDPAYKLRVKAQDVKNGAIQTANVAGGRFKDGVPKLGGVSLGKTYLQISTMSVDQVMALLISRGITA